MFAFRTRESGSPEVRKSGRPEDRRTFQISDFGFSHFQKGRFVMFNYDSFLENKLRQLKEDGSYRYFLEVNKSAQHFPHFYYVDNNGVQRSAVNWCSNDYLCMSTREEVIAKLGFVTHRSGTGSSGTRNISGTTIYHRELESTLA